MNFKKCLMVHHVWYHKHSKFAKKKWLLHSLCMNDFLSFPSKRNPSRLVWIHPSFFFIHIHDTYLKITKIFQFIYGYFCFKFHNFILAVWKKSTTWKSCKSDSCISFHEMKASCEESIYSHAVYHVKALTVK